MPENQQNGLDKQREDLLKKLYTYINDMADIIAAGNPALEHFQRMDSLSRALPAVAINPRAPQGPA